MKRPNYDKNTQDKELFAELRRRVNNIVNNLPKSRDNYIKLKAIILPFLYFGLYIFALYNSTNTFIYILSFVVIYYEDFINYIHILQIKY